MKPLAARRGLGLAILTAARRGAGETTPSLSTPPPDRRQPALLGLVSVGHGTASRPASDWADALQRFEKRELSFQRVRGDGVLNDDMGIYKGPGVRWTKFDTHLEAIALGGQRRSGAQPARPRGERQQQEHRPVTYTQLQGYSSTPSSSTAWTSTHGRRRAMVLGGLERARLSRVLERVERERVDRQDDRVLHALRQLRSTPSPPSFRTRSSGDRRPPSRARSRRSCSTARSRKRVSFASSHVYPGGANAGTSANANGLVDRQQHAASARSRAAVTRRRR